MSRTTRSARARVVVLSSEGLSTDGLDRSGSRWARERHKLGTTVGQSRRRIEGIGSGFRWLLVETASKGQGSQIVIEGLTNKS